MGRSPQATFCLPRPLFAWWHEVFDHITSMQLSYREGNAFVV
jgi:hypothetical protein